MFDSVNALDLPEGAQMVAGYLDLRYKWADTDWQRFPTAVRVGIVCSHLTNDGHVLDVERGDADPADAPGWVLMRRAAGCDPTVYCSMAAWPAVRAAFTAASVAEPHYWIADWTDVPHIPGGAVACQYQNRGTVDASVCLDYWPGVDNGQSWPAGPAAPAAPAPPPPPSAAHSQLQAIRADLAAVLSQVDELLTLVP